MQITSMIYSEFEYVTTNVIQGDSGGKVNILGGNSIGHCEKKSSYEHVPNSEWLPR
jgi:hypothetical protein